MSPKSETGYNYLINATVSLLTCRYRPGAHVVMPCPKGPERSMSHLCQPSSTSLLCPPDCLPFLSRGGRMHETVGGGVGIPEPACMETPACHQPSNETPGRSYDAASLEPDYPMNLDEAARYDRHPCHAHPKRKGRIQYPQPCTHEYPHAILMDAYQFSGGIWLGTLCLGWGKIPILLFTHHLDTFGLSRESGVASVPC